MAIGYTQEYWDYLNSIRAAQTTNTSWEALNIIKETQPELSAWDIVNMMPDYVESETSSYGYAYKTLMTNQNGEVIGCDFVDVTQTVQNPPAVIDSNIGNSTYNSASRPIMVNGSAGGSGSSIFSKGAKVLSTELPASTVASKVGWGIGAVMLGTKLGKLISSGIYAIGGGWQFNPDNWKSILVGDDVDPLDKLGFRTLFKIAGVDDGTGSITPYMDADALGAMYLMLLQMGAYSTGAEYISGSGDDTRTTLSKNSTIPISVGGYEIPSAQGGSYAGGRATYLPSGNTAPVYVTALDNTNNTSIASVCAYSSSPFSLVCTRYRPNSDAVLSSNTVTATKITRGDIVFYMAATNPLGYTQADINYIPITCTLRDKNGNVVNGNNSYASQDVGYLIYTGTVATGGAEGISDDGDATYHPSPDVITSNTVDGVNQQLRNNYPQLYDGELVEKVPQPDGTTKEKHYVPVPFPNTTDKTKPITGDNHQNNPNSNPDTNTLDQLQDIIDLILTITNKDLDKLDNPDTTPPDTGDGNTPTVVTPVGNASSLWKIYNPTQAQVDAFGAWLWSSNFVDQIKKLFNDPMQGIIGIHKVFATPSIGGQATIKVGYLDSEVPSAYIDNQYTTVDCGTASLREYFGNVFDYSPYTKVSLYLPFIGIVDLDVSDVMRSTIKVKYHVDVLSGACLAEVIVNRDNAGGVLYQYAGSAIVTYPVSSGTYLGALAGVAAVATGAVATIMTGGVASSALAVAGTATGLSHLHANVGHSGAFNGCAGAMGGKKPYLIISRPQTAMADNYKHFTGMPANAHVTLSNCNGYTKVKAVYAKSIDKATEEEKNMIESQLMQGVLV